MLRVFATTLLLSAPLLITQSAAAQDCFCGVAPTFGMADAAPETHDTTIVSTVLAVPRTEHVPAALAVLWCNSGNDPRCMPMQSSDAPAFRALSGGPVAVAIDPTKLGALRVARDMIAVTPAEGLEPAHGIRRSIERPPRG